MAAGLLSGAVSPPADLLVSADARLIALDGLYVQTRPGYAPFVRDVWQQYWAAPLAAPFPEDGLPGWVQCGADGCRIRQGGVVVVLARSPRPAACDGVALVVSAEPARGVCPGAALIDRFAVWRDGAFAVWLGEGRAAAVSDRGWRGERPWVPAPPAPVRSRVGLPMAAAEVIPGE